MADENNVDPNNANPNPDPAANPQPDPNPAPVGDPPADDPKPGDAPDPAPNDPQPDPDPSDDPKEFSEDIWGSTGDEVGDSVLKMMHEGGLEPDAAKALVYDAVKAGDPSKIDRDALVEKVGKERATLIMAGINDFTTRNAAKVQAGIDAVHEAAGGKDAWDTMLPWIAKNVPEGDLAEYRGMIDAGGKQAKFAVGELAALYNADPKNEEVGAKDLEGDAVSKKTPPGISRREYGDQLNKLHRTGKATPQALTALKAQRARGIQQGK